jgi:2-polyprenyl-3-methyl-5-hydroxy-6-metoxy-1,4-benzoquinol methylase
VFRQQLGQLAARARGAAVAARLLNYSTATSPPTVAAWARQYDRGDWEYLSGIHQLAHYSVLAGYVAFLDGRVILDVGCGTGLLRARLSGINFERYVGIDPVSQAIDRANKLADERTQFVVGDLFTIDYGGFDTIVCNEILYCLPNLEHQLDRIVELMTDGSHLLTSNMRHPGDVGMYRLLENRLELVDSVELSNDSERGRRRWRVSAYRRR